MCAGDCVAPHLSLQRVSLFMRGVVQLARGCCEEEAPGTRMEPGVVPAAGGPTDDEDVCYYYQYCVCNVIMGTTVQIKVEFDSMDLTTETLNFDEIDGDLERFQQDEIVSEALLKVLFAPVCAHVS